MKCFTAIACAVLAVLCAAGTGQAKYFGNRDAGSGILDIEGRIVACKYTLSENATAHSMSAAMDFDANEVHGKLLIFEDAGSGPGDLVACTEVINGKNIAAASQCWESKFASPVSLAAGDYYLAVWMDVTAGAGRVRLTFVGGTHDVYFDTLAYFDADTCVSAWGDGTNYTWDISVWVNYIAEGDLSYTFYGGHGGYTKDSYSDGGNITQVNGGGVTPLLVGSYVSIGTKRYSAWMAVSGIEEIIPGEAVITSAICSVYVELVYQDIDSLGAFRVLKPWTEGYGLATGRNAADSGVTWTYWAIEDAYNWTTAGALLADDDSTDNNWDGNGGDTKATPECWLTDYDSAGWYGWKEIVISNALAQAWLDGDAVQNGFLLREPYPDGHRMAISSCENGLILDCMPRWYFEWTMPSAGSGRRKVIQESQ